MACAPSSSDSTDRRPDEPILDSPTPAERDALLDRGAAALRERGIEPQPVAADRELSVAWSVAGLLWLGPRLFPEHWFDRGIADYGQSQGNVATGFILAEMADPAHVTGAAAGYGYKQLFYEPFLGGGILTGLSVPIIIGIGSLRFGIASAAATAGLVVCGVRRGRRVGGRR